MSIGYLLSQVLHFRRLFSYILRLRLLFVKYMSLRFIDQTVIRFHTFYEILSLHQKNAPKYIFLHVSSEDSVKRTAIRREGVL